MTDTNKPEGLKKYWKEVETLLYRHEIPLDMRNCLERVFYSGAVAAVDRILRDVEANTLVGETSSKDILESVKVVSQEIAQELGESDRETITGLPQSKPEPEPEPQPPKARLCFRCRKPVGDITDPNSCHC
jgi:hypothetical protein